MKLSDTERNNMHIHSFREITEYFGGNIDVGHIEGKILHVFECSCGFTLIEKAKASQRSLSQKKTTIYTVVKKSAPEFSHNERAISQLRAES